MTTIFHLVRHGENDVLKHSIAGRTPGVHLNEVGRAQANALGKTLAAVGIDWIVSSPLDRAVETAQPLATLTGKTVELAPALLEIDYGDWTGCTFEELRTLEAWQKWNAFRSGHCVPNGETMSQVQLRVVSELERLRNTHPGKSIAVFSHGDPIRAALLYYLGMPLDFVMRLQSIPGSFSTLAIDDWGPQLRTFNSVPG